MNIMRFKYLFFSISLFFLIPGIFSLFTWGLKSGIDFTGGSLLEIRLEAEDLSRDKLNEFLPENIEIESVQESGENQYILRSKNLDNSAKTVLISLINNNLGPVEELRYELVGPILGKELLVKTLTAVVLVSAIITIYVWRQFDQLKYGVSAILAMFHDSLILLGTFSILGHFHGFEIDVLFVTALLTTLSFSVHDTIVVFDRIREQKSKHAGVPFEEIVNLAVIETLGRSINNSITIIIMLLCLYLLGGETIRGFSLALLIGAVTGTYSSTFTAAPLLLLWDQLVRLRK